jgi:hypothetical protein
MGEEVAEQAPLRPLAHLGGDLVLRRPSWRKGLYELLAGDAVVGRLDTRVWSGAARAETAEGAWRFDRPRGLSGRRVRILDAEDDREVAALQRSGWGRGARLQLDGRDLRLTAHGYWKPAWSWWQDGEELATVTTRHVFKGEKGRVVLTPAGQASPHAAFLALLGAHLVLLSERESSSASG